MSWSTYQGARGTLWTSVALEGWERKQEQYMSRGAGARWRLRWGNVTRVHRSDPRRGHGKCYMVEVHDQRGQQVTSTSSLRKSPGFEIQIPALTRVRLPLGGEHLALPQKTKTKRPPKGQEKAGREQPRELERETYVDAIDAWNSRGARRPGRPLLARGTSLDKTAHTQVSGARGATGSARPRRPEAPLPPAETLPAEAGLSKPDAPTRARVPSAPPCSAWG